MKPTVTVVITNWNYGMFLEEAIWSVLNQTVKADRIIVADDGSTDNSVEIVKKFQAEGHPIELSRVETRQGLPTNLRRTADLVTTEWMCFLAADDIFKPTYIERFREVVAQCDERLAIVYSDMEKFGLWQGVWNVAEWDADMLHRGNYINGHSFVKVAVYREAGGYRPHVDGNESFFEDHYLWVDIVDLNKGYYGRRIPEPLVMYRRHEFGHRTDHTDLKKR